MDRKRPYKASVEWDGKCGITVTGGNRNIFVPCNQKVSVKEGFIASARCYQVKYANGSVATEENTEVWLGMSRDQYYQCERSLKCAYVFETKEQVLRRWKDWDGMPWYFRLKPDSLTIYRYSLETVKIEKIEVEKDG